MTRRLLLAMLGLTAVVLAVLEIPLGLNFHDHEQATLIAKVEHDASAIANYVATSFDGALPPAEIAAIAARYSQTAGGRVVIVDGEGMAVADSAPPPGAAPSGRFFVGRPEFTTALSGEVATGTRPSDTLQRSLVYAAVPISSGGKIDGAVRITYPTSEVDRRVRRNWWILAALGIATLLVAALGASLLGRSVTLPLRDLQQAAAALGAGQLTERAPTGAGPPEVRDLAKTFNRMADRLSHLVLAQEQFVSDASHELRTPLTALRLRLEMMEGEEPDASQLGPALVEVQRLGHLVDGLLSLARADRPDPLAPSALPAMGILSERQESWEPLAEEGSVRLVLERNGSDPSLLADRSRVVQVLDNLLANALDVSPPRSTVTLRAVAHHAAVELHVIDEGPGLSEEERDRAFDRFWRSGTSRGRFGGSGIGLAIVRRLVETDGGTVALREAEGGGLDAVVSYPQARPAN